jgi:hypothetical protein
MMIVEATLMPPEFRSIEACWLGLDERRDDV